MFDLSPCNLIYNRILTYFCAGKILVESRAKLVEDVSIIDLPNLYWIIYCSDGRRRGVGDTLVLAGRAAKKNSNDAD